MNSTLKKGQIRIEDMWNGGHLAIGEHQRKFAAASHNSLRKPQSVTDVSENEKKNMARIVLGQRYVTTEVQYRVLANGDKSFNYIPVHVFNQSFVPVMKIQCLFFAWLGFVSLCVKIFNEQIPA